MRPKRNILSKTILSIKLAGLTGLAGRGFQITAKAAEIPTKPNILFIVADDMGYADISVQGCKDVPTPNIDALAASGIRFTDGYVTGAVCSPSRAALITGRYQQREGIDDWVKPGAAGLTSGVPTVADYLRKAGYRTALIGKWHLGEAESANPLNRGFDEFYGFLGGGRSYFPDGPEEAKVKANRYTQLVRGKVPAKETEYMTFAFAREATEFIERQKTTKQPFFLYLAFNAVHTPLEAPENYLQRFSSITDKRRRTYAGMVAAMDDSVGRVLKAVRDAGIEENTLICFISDNGGPITRNAPNASSNGELRGGKGQTWEGGIRVPFLMHWRGQLPEGITYSKPVIQMDLTATALALAGQTPDPKWAIDGVNLMPFLKSPLKDATPHETLYWAYEAQWAVRQGSWKLVNGDADGSGKTQKTILGLYDLSTDKGERNNLAATEPERVKALEAAYQQWHTELCSSHTGATPPADQKSK